MTTIALPRTLPFTTNLAYYPNPSPDSTMASMEKVIEDCRELIVKRRRAAQRTGRLLRRQCQPPTLQTIASLRRRRDAASILITGPGRGPCARGDQSHIPLGEVESNVFDFLVAPSFYKLG
jgi:hypothetical protein